MEMFGVDDIFTPQEQVCSAKGAVVTNIAHIPQALTKVMALNGIEPDMPAKGDLSLKPWFGNSQGLSLPKELDLPVPEILRKRLIGKITDNEVGALLAEYELIKN